MSNTKKNRKDLRIFLAEMWDGFLMAMDALRSHKLRSVLTLLGILVGVFSIIVVMTVMHAMQKQISNELEDLGGRSFYVSRWPAVHFGPSHDEKYFRRKNITYAQGEALAERATLARAVALSMGFSVNDMSSRYAKGPPNVSMTGTTVGGSLVENWTIQDGRFLLNSDIEGAHDVCILGNSLSKVLFPVGSAVGERVKINGINYLVIGVLEAKGSMAGGNQDNFVLIPLTTGLNRFGAWRWSVNIGVLAQEDANIDDVMEQVRGILRLVRKVQPGAEDDFEIISKDSIMAQINSVTFAVRLGVTLVSSIALVAAGIGIMNIMLVSVTERTREIGIRRAIGAKKRNIMAQFIMEAVVLCEVGGVLGIFCGIVGGNLAGHFLKLPVVFPLNSTLMALGICSLVGMVFGTYPAYKAANLDPIESLRYE